MLLLIENGKRIINTSELSCIYPDSLIIVGVYKGETEPVILESFAGDDSFDAFKKLCDELAAAHELIRFYHEDHENDYS